MITFNTAERGEVDINPAFITAVCQPASSTDVPQPTFISIVGGLTYSVPLPIADVRKRLTEELMPVVWLGEVIETLTNVIRNR